MTVLEHMERIARGESPPPGIATLLGFTLPETSTLMTLRGEQAAGR